MTTESYVPLFLLPLLFLLSLPLHSESQSQWRELQILLKIKTGWGNPPSLHNWTDSSINGSHCNWPEISCTKYGFVNEIKLQNKDLSRPIPSAICELKNLNHIDLNWNNIPGNFPTVLYNCTNLIYLDIAQNYFAGPIPSDINRLSSLRYLYLYGNNFSGDVPPAIGRLSNLVHLHLNQNQFNGSIPSEIGNLSNLEELFLNDLMVMLAWQIPHEFGHLKKLKSLWIRGSNLTGSIPASLTNLTDLEYLNLPNNNLSGEIPIDLFKLRNLKIVHLFHNRLSGEIPRPIEAFGLTSVDLSMNQLTGTIPEDFGLLNNLTIMFLYYNRLSGEIPPSIGRLPLLTDIRLFNNSLMGILPPELGLHSKLVNFEVCNNKLFGSLPENLCHGGVLQGLVVFSNNLSGTVPESLNHCPSLGSVQLHKNAFCGEIPEGFWTAENLSMVKMNDNSFTGQLPDKLASNLLQLDISNNKFSGEIPTKISDSTILMAFIASNNQFSGELPASLMALSQLQRLQLDGNRISGTIPSVITSWKSLNVLNLANNQLTGKIPAAIGSLLSLNSLNLSGNHLSGEVPPELSSLKLISELDLSSNSLTGKVPDGLDNPGFKASFLNNPGLCTSNPLFNLSNCNSQRSKSEKISPHFLTAIVAISGFVTLILIFLAWFAIQNYQKRKQIQDQAAWKLTSFQQLNFTKPDILQGLIKSNMIGSGGSGNVYRITVGKKADDVVAVKKIWNSKSLEVKLEKEFQAEIEILGRIKHANIVKLLCCISSNDSKLLVYEYMENGSLDRWLHRKRNGDEGGGTMLDWPSRLKIAIGAAQGLSYMHHACTPPIIHRDMKSSNILLDSEFKARIADFGLARMLAKHGQPEYSSVVGGTFGYIAPEHAYTKRVNKKIDVYSFGVVLLELATGREACDNLAEWAWHHFQDGNDLVEALDEEIKESAYLKEMSSVFKLGLACTAPQPSDRPSMKEVLQVLIQCGPPQNFCSKRASNQHDVASLLHSTSPLFGNIGGGNKTASLEDPDESFV